MGEIYIYIERERERESGCEREEREGEREGEERERERDSERETIISNSLVRQPSVIVMKKKYFALYISIGLKSFKRNINAPYSSDVRVLACDTSGCGVQIFSSTGHKPG